MPLSPSQSRSASLTDPSPRPSPKRQKTSSSSSDASDNSGPAATDATTADLPLTEDTGDGLDDLTSSLPEVKEAPVYTPAKKSPVGTFTRSIYVDAFNLALDTVLQDEAYLFSEEEAEAFARYRSLEYEAQHLYVRLFLRKSSAWFRVDKLHYPRDISDISKACETLRNRDVGFADSDEMITLEEAAGLLPVDELKVLAKDMLCIGVGGGGGNGAGPANKGQIIAQLKKACKGQASLQKSGQLRLSFDAKGNHKGKEKQLIERILKITGPCIRLNSKISTLFNRVHLVFYRSTEWSEKSLTTVILSRTMKRNFPDYIVCRTSNIFPTRDALLQFETAIKLQSTVDEHLESGVASESDLKAVRDIFTETYPLWESLVEVERQNARAATGEEEIERVYLRRFAAAWVYTRIIHKGVYVLGRFKEYALEHRVLTELLTQPYFQPARRGTWYQRKALIEENYLAALDDAYSEKPEATTRKWKKMALETCEAGLRDPQCHIIYHHELQKRIMKLERKLKVPKRDQHDFGHARLNKPVERVFYGRRINDATIGRKSLWEDPSKAKLQERNENTNGSAAQHTPENYKQATFAKDGTIRRINPSTGISVEEMCLYHYHLLGWKGLHTESHLSKTLFAYLFYDILFLFLPNVFQTPYQTSPLDLFTDAFYPCRASEINHRLVEISNGGAARIVRNVWEREYKRKPCVVGLDWELDIDMLTEICKCIPGEALAVICRVLCQEYRQRSGGMPDLFLWRVWKGKEGKDEVKGECCFAEVKSENDRLSDTQRMWIHVLTSAGVKVELCAARNTKNEDEKKKDNRNT